MSLEEFTNTLPDEQPDPEWSPLLQAMWYDGTGNWEEAHNIAQDVHSKEGSWVHAYLHRKESDDFNAAYWYNRAGKPVPSVSLDDEWKKLTEFFLK